MLKKILVVCVGNICRSPMAEALLIQCLSPGIPDAQISSAGINALVGYPADKIAQEIMSENAIDLSNHRAQQATNEILLASDLIFVMETGHQRHLEGSLPQLLGRVHRLGKWGNFDIPDPYKRPRLVFEQTFQLIKQGVNEWQQKLIKDTL